MWWIIVSLVLLGILLMAIELLLIPGVGVAGILSIASFIAACWYAFVFCGETAGVITTAVVILIVVSFTVIILRAKTWKRFALNTEISQKTNEDALKLSVGQQGKTLTRLAPMGTAVFGTLETEVKSEDNSMLDSGTEVIITRIEDNKVIVKQLNK